MVNFLGNGMAWLESQRKAHLSSSVVYRRGATSILLQATIGSSRHQIATRSDMYTEVQSRDYLVAVADLQTAGLWPPQRGDKVEEGGVVYATLPVSGDVVWSPLSGFGGTARVHTKLDEG